jgi:large subunit ribosomal protein L37Ae
MANTKKVKQAGRFGSRYGVGIRKRLLKTEAKQEKSYDCPFCGFKKVKRKASGIFICRKCHAKFAGGAYLPVTLPGSIIKKTVQQKGFSSKAAALEKELEKAKEEEPKKEEKKEKK